MTQPKSAGGEMSWAERALAAALYVVLAIALAIATHVFFAYIAHYPYWSIDDGLAVVSTSWVDTGYYGDPSVPIEGFTDVQRYRGFLNYGPWSFGAGAIVTWLFGFSIPALRAVHLVAALALPLAAVMLLRGLRAAIAVTIIGVSVAYAVVAIQWPMVRPDVFVTVFAVGAIASAAVGIRRGNVLPWFACGLAAGCGAFSHLIGAGLLPASLALVMAGWLIRRRLGATPARGFVAPIAAVAAGWLASALMFYGSIGFRFADHLSVLLNYRTMVRAMTESALSTNSPAALWAEHYRIASSGVPGFYIVAVVVSMVVAVMLLAHAWVKTPATAIETVALLLPGSAILAVYVLCLGFYSNFHTGYVILPQLLGTWVVGTTIYVTLGEIKARLGPAGRFIEMLAAIIVIVLVARSAYGMSAGNPRLALTRSWIGISAYLEQVLGPIPRGAVAWGAAPFAAEGPGRIQLMSLKTVLWMLSTIPAERREPLAPDYLVWGHPQSQDAVIDQFAQPDFEPLQQLAKVLPRTEFVATTIVSAAPYGATRVYERRLPGEPPPARLPAISAWDSGQRRWLNQVEPAGQVAWQPSAGRLRATKGRRSWTRLATDGVTADLPAGWYLFRVEVNGGRAYGELMTAGTGAAHDYPAGDLPPPIDVAARLGTEPIQLLLHHEGGAVGLNLYAGDAATRIAGVETFRVDGLTDYRLSRERMAEQPLPALSNWQPDAGSGVTAVAMGGALEVTGNASQFGYQLVSPRLAVTPGAEVSLRLPITVSAGRVCTGILDERQQNWIVWPHDPSEPSRFNAGANTAVFAVVSNCYQNAGAAVASRFTVTPGGYAVLADRWYVETLMREFQRDYQ